MYFNHKGKRYNLDADMFAAFTYGVVGFASTLGLVALIGYLVNAVAALVVGVFWFLGIAALFFRFAWKCLSGLHEEEGGYKEMRVHHVGNYFISRVPGAFNFLVIKQRIISKNGKPEYAVYSYKRHVSTSLCDLVAVAYTGYANTPTTKYHSKLPHLTGCDEVIGCGGSRETRYSRQRTVVSRM